MTRNLFALLLLSLLFSGCGNKTYIISGELTNAEPDAYIYLDRLGGINLETVDSIIIDDKGYFKFEGSATYPEFFLLRIDETNFLTTLIEPGEKMKVKAFADSLNFPVKLSGSPGTQAMVDYDIKMKEVTLNLQKLNAVYQENINSPDLDQIMSDLNNKATEILDEMNLYTRNFIDENLTSMVSLIALYKQISPGVYILNIDNDLDYYKKVDSTLFGLYPESEAVKSLHTQLATVINNINQQLMSEELTGIGAEAPEIALPNPAGDTIRLSSTRGKYVLLDFWAAWCTPCRNENPNLVAAYKKYNNKGFEIVQVSLDQTREAWLQGINDDKLGDWVHISDLQYWNSIVVPLYGIKSIPASFLLDKEGRVIASNLRGEALSIKLSEILD